ncbi:hypothetical protein BDN70DRAFT_849837, partial [Pholiota conissans]
MSSLYPYRAAGIILFGGFAVITQATRIRFKIASLSWRLETTGIGIFDYLITSSRKSHGVYLSQNLNGQRNATSLLSLPPLRPETGQRQAPFYYWGDIKNFNADKITMAMFATKHINNETPVVRVLPIYQLKSMRHISPEQC